MRPCRKIDGLDSPADAGLPTGGHPDVRPHRAFPRRIAGHDADRSAPPAAARNRSSPDFHEGSRRFGIPATARAARRKFAPDLDDRRQPRRSLPLCEAQPSATPVACACPRCPGCSPGPMLRTGLRRNTATAFFRVWRTCFAGSRARVCPLPYTAALGGCPSFASVRRQTRRAQPPRRHIERVALSGGRLTRVDPLPIRWAVDPREYRRDRRRFSVSDRAIRRHAHRGSSCRRRWQCGQRYRRGWRARPMPGPEPSFR